MALRIRHTRRSMNRKYVPSTRSSTTTRTSTGKGSYTTSRTESATPSVSTTTQSGGTPYPVVSVDGNTGLVILMATGLFLMATWKDLVSPMWDRVNGKQSAINLPFGEIVGGIVFIAIIGIIASTGSTGYSIMLWMLIAMWLLFIMFNGQGQLASITGWLSGKQNGSTSTTPSPTQTNTNTNTQTGGH